MSVMKAVSVILLAMSLLLPSSSAHAGFNDRVGVIKTMVGEVSIDRRGGTLRGVPNLKLFEGDVIRTGSSGRAGLILEDDTLISMGGGSKLAIDRFLYQPYEKEFSFVARVLEGTFSFICGHIAKLAPSQVHIQTPNATIGVRGTHLLIDVN